MINRRHCSHKVPAKIGTTLQGKSRTRNTLRTCPTFQEGSNGDALRRRLRRHMTGRFVLDRLQVIHDRHGAAHSYIFPFAARRLVPTLEVPLLILSMLPLISLLIPHHPITVMLCICLLALFRLHRLLHLELIRNVHPFLRCWTVIDDLHPALDARKRGGRDACPFCPVCPATSVSL